MIYRFFVTVAHSHWFRSLLEESFDDLNSRALRTDINHSCLSPYGILRGYDKSDKKAVLAA